MYIDWKPEKDTDSGKIVSECGLTPISFSCVTADFK